ncbi:MAG: polymer-forming cytoskeletal protein [Phycisphaerales bacterium]
MSDWRRPLIRPGWIDDGSSIGHGWPTHPHPPRSAACRRGFGSSQGVGALESGAPALGVGLVAAMHHDVLIDHACVTGAVKARGSVVVARDGCCVASTIDASSVRVAGGVKGAVSATRDVRIEAGACFAGDCSADSLVVDEGAVIEGGFFEIGRARLRSSSPRR